MVLIVMESYLLKAKKTNLGKSLRCETTIISVDGDDLQR